MLLVVGLLAGVVTTLSPCVLPVYTLDRARTDADRQLELRFSRGVSAYAFTFG